MATSGDLSWPPVGTFSWPRTTFSAWAEIFGDAVAVAAMVDRLVQHAEIIVLQSDSYRLKDRAKEVIGSEPTEPRSVRPALTPSDTLCTTRGAGWAMTIRWSCTGTGREDDEEDAVSAPGWLPRLDVAPG